MKVGGEFLNEALVNPKNSPWMDGPSTVYPLPTGKPRSNIPLKNYMETNINVMKSTYPNGHALIPRGNPPPTTQAVLPVVETPLSSYPVSGLGVRPYEYGVVVFFI